MGPGVRWLVYALFLCSGATALVYQVAWTRSLTLILGASHEAISIVLASFMAGLAAGGVVFGRWSERVRRPLQLYGWVEIGVAVFAVALIPLLRGVDAAYVGMTQHLEGSGSALNTLRVGMAFAVLVLPTFFMGGTLPLLVRFLVAGDRDLRSGLSGLYAINTFGAVLGTLAGGFVLLPRLGMFGAQMVAVAGNVVIGVAAIVLDRRFQSLRGRGGAHPAAASAEPLSGGVAPAVAVDRGAACSSPAPSWEYRLAFWGTAAAGMGALALEVCWSRALAVVCGSTVYSFTVMLAAFLIGIALGSGLHGLVPLRRIAVSVQFGAVMLLIGACAFVVSRIIPRLPELAVRLNVSLHGGMSGVRASTTLLLSFVVMLVPCILMGVAFPLAGQARARLKDRPGEAVGDVVGLNTLGAIAGSLLAGFVLIPRVGLQRAMLIACAAYATFGLLVLAAAAMRRRPEQARATVLATSLAIAALGMGAATAPSWDPRLLAAFQNNKTATLLDDEGRVDMGTWLETTELLYHKAGRSANISVLEVAGYRWLAINGKCVAGDSLEDLHHEYLLGHLPTLLHPAPKTAAVIGLGAGITLGGVAADDGLEDIVVVEIEPAVVGGANLFAELHDDALSDPRVRVVFQDGRNFLKTTPRRFDVITADPIHPWAQGASYLYTREYFRMAATRLNPGGVMCQWLPLYELSQENLRSVVATFATAFPHTTVWQAYGDVLLIGSDAPLRVDVDALARRLTQPRVARQLSRIGLDDPVAFLAEFTMDRDAVARFAAGAVINTDDNLYLEFSSPKSTGSGLGDEHALLISGYRQSAACVASGGGNSFATRESLEAALETARAAKSATIQAYADWIAVVDADPVVVWSTRADLYRRILADAPEYRPARHRLADCLAELAWIHLMAGRAESAQPLLEEALTADPGNAAANFHVATRMSQRDALEEAAPLYRAALARQPRFPEASFGLGMALAGMGRFDEAADALRAVAGAAPMRGVVAAVESFCVARAGDAAASMTDVVETPSEDAASVFGSLGNSLAARGFDADAVAALRCGLRFDRDDPALSLNLAWLLATAADDAVRNGAEALRLAEQIARSGEHPGTLDVLAAAQAEVGRFEDALVSARRALGLAERAGMKPLADQIRGRITGYEQRRAFRRAQQGA